MDNYQPQNNTPPGKPTVWEANPRLKTLLLALIFVFLVSGLGLIILMQAQNSYRQKIYVETERLLPKRSSESVKTYNSAAVGVAFQYPEKISVTEKDGIVTLNHQIPFENHGDCSMKGDEQTYPMLNDLNVKIRVLNGSVARAVKQLSPYMPAENFNGESLKISPGFIDRARVGSFEGYSIYEGAEGCGHVIYYFPIAGGRTLVITKDLVELLSGIVAPEVRNAVLAVPGVITPEKSDDIFRQVVSSLKVSPPEGLSADGKTYTGHTVYGEQYRFSVERPTGWVLSESRGASAFAKGQCVIVLGAGGHGLPGTTVAKTVDVTTASGLAGTVSVYNSGGGQYAFVNFRNDYIFEFSTTKADQDCFNDYLGVVRSVKVPDQDTTGWKIYKNEQYKFSVNYPSAWVYKADRGNMVSFCKTGEACGLVDEGVAGRVLIAVEDNPDRLSARKFLERKGVVAPGTASDSQDITVNGHRAVRLGPEGLAAEGSVYIENDGYIVMVQGQSQGSEFENMVNSIVFATGGG